MKTCFLFAFLPIPKSKIKFYLKNIETKKILVKITIHFYNQIYVVTKCIHWQNSLCVYTTFSTIFLCMCWKIIAKAIVVPLVHFYIHTYKFFSSNKKCIVKAEAKAKYRNRVQYVLWFFYILPVLLLFNIYIKFHIVLLKTQLEDFFDDWTWLIVCLI